MFPRLLEVFDAGTLIFVAWGLLRLPSTIQHTTLTTVWPWMWVAWTAAAVGTALRIVGNTTLVSYVDYFTAVAVLSPPLASLGARRPTCRSWPLFVLLPMFAVLFWPAISVGLATRFAKPLELDTPAVVMYIVVLIMAMGNYALGRLGGLVVVFSAMMAVQVSGASQHWPGFLRPEFQHFLMLWVAVFLIFGFRDVAASATRNEFEFSDTPDIRRDPLDAILFEFGELYGLVWSLRMQDRLNVFAAQQKWPGRFEGRRGIWAEPLSDAQRADIERAFRWLFRRFVDPEWLDIRLKSAGTVLAKEAFASRIDS